jgi:hypothetical protein
VGVGVLVGVAVAVGVSVGRGVAVNVGVGVVVLVEVDTATGVGVVPQPLTTKANKRNMVINGRYNGFIDALPPEQLPLLVGLVGEHHGVWPFCT